MNPNNQIVTLLISLVLAIAAITIAAIFRMPPSKVPAPATVQPPPPTPSLRTLEYRPERDGGNKARFTF